MAAGLAAAVLVVAPAQADPGCDVNPDAPICQPHIPIEPTPPPPPPQNLPPTNAEPTFHAAKLCETCTHDLIVTRTADNRLYFTRGTGGVAQFSAKGWLEIPGNGRTPYAPAVTFRSGTLVQVFVVGLGGNGVHYQTYNSANGAWNPAWTAVPGGGVFRNGPAVANQGTNGIALYAPGQNNQIWWSTWTPSAGWLGAWYQAPTGPPTDNQPAAAWDGSAIVLIVRTTLNQIFQTRAGSAWTEVTGAGRTIGAPTIAQVSPSHLLAMVTGTDHTVWYQVKQANGGAWTSAWRLLPDPGQAAGGPVVTGAGGAYVQGTDGGMWASFYKVNADTGASISFRSGAPGHWVRLDNSQYDPTIPGGLYTSAGYLPADRYPSVSGFSTGPSDYMEPLNANRAQFPYSTAVELTFKDEAGNAVRGCSGTMIGPRAVLTAAHCAFLKNSPYLRKGTVTSVANTVGCSFANAFTPPEYRHDPGTSSDLPTEVVAWDYAVVTLTCDLGYDTGWLRVIAGEQTITGMAISRTCVNADDFTGWQRASGKVSYTSFNYRYLKYYLQGEHGCSGSAIYDTGLRIHAVSSNVDPGDRGGNAHAAAGKASRITYRVFDDLEAFKTQCTTVVAPGCGN